MTASTWGSLFRRQRCCGTTRNFPTFPFRKSISWTDGPLRAACRCFASRLRVKLRFRSEAPSRASSRSICRSGEPNAYDQPPEANEYLPEGPLFMDHSPHVSCFFLVLISLSPNVITSSFGTHPPVASIHL